LSVLWIISSDCSFGIFKLSLQSMKTKYQWIMIYSCYKTQTRTQISIIASSSWLCSMNRG
jgi:hypothetical protein